jgi:NAD(P)-dependent dehydrogenase (short-subunit alcohol dehydrogenase family)
VSKILLITGAGRGIGARRAACRARGYDVAVNYLRDERPPGVVSAVKAPGARASRSRATWRERRCRAHLRDRSTRSSGGSRTSSTTPASTGGYSRLEDADTAMMRSVLELNVLGALMCAKAAIRAHVDEAGRAGRRDRAASRRWPPTLGSAGEYVWYAASKGAIDSMTVGLSRELAATGIRVLRGCRRPDATAASARPAGRLAPLIRSRASARNRRSRPRQWMFLQPMPILLYDRPTICASRWSLTHLGCRL